MDGLLSQSIFQDELNSTIEFYQLTPSKTIFQHDNDPKHKSRIVQEQLAKHEKPPTSMLDLWESVQEEWEKITADVCTHLVESMPRRVRVVIKTKGRWTRY
ncbi:hypothetical protein CLOP_g15683 [Closterium sp. NIES-67]|nr:hypothetical protein CLOP_g15683 [Closterium sp. NIES-67]